MIPFLYIYINKYYTYIFICINYLVMEITYELILFKIKQPKTIKNKFPSLKSNCILLSFTYMVLSTRFTHISFICLHIHTTQRI